MSAQSSAETRQTGEHFLPSFRPKCWTPNGNSSEEKARRGLAG